MKNLDISQQSVNKLIRKYGEPEPTPPPTAVPSPVVNTDKKKYDPASEMSSDSDAGKL